MKKLLPFLLLVLSCMSAFGQATPPSYPYPNPLPTVGSTPGTTLRVTATINTTSYADNRPVIWDDFVGGGYRIVTSTTERDSILSGVRKQGMWVKVVDDGHVYELATNLTAWVDLGFVGVGSFGGSSTNIYNSNGTQDGNRVVTGGGFGLTFTGQTNITLASTVGLNLIGTVSASITAPNVDVNGGSFVTINADGPDPFVFPAAPAIPTGTAEIMARDPVTGNVVYGPAYTLDGGAVGLPIWSSTNDLTYLTAYPDAIVIDANGTNTLTINNTNAFDSNTMLARFQQYGTNQFMIWPDGSVFYGPNSLGFWGGAPEQTPLLSYRATDMGDLDTTTIYIQQDSDFGTAVWQTDVGTNKIQSKFTSTGPGGAQSVVQFESYVSGRSDVVFNGTEGQSELQLNSTIAGLFSNQDIIANGQVAYIRTLINNTQRMELFPSASSTGTAYTLDTSLAHTSGNLLAVSNNGTNKFTVDFSGHATAASVEINGPDGFAFADFDQNPTLGPSSSASGFRLYANDLHRFTWKDSQDTAARSFAGSLTDNRVYTLPDANMTFARSDAAQTFTGKQTFTSPVKLQGYTVATLPAGVEGDFAYVTDALTPSYLVTVVGGGAIKVPVFYNGSNWVAH